MSPLTWQRLTAIAAAFAALVWLFSRVALSRGLTPMAVPWSVPLVCMVAGALALGSAWAVRQYVAGKRPSLDPLRAARTVVYAQACAYAGSVLGGSYGGYALAVAVEWGHAPRRAVALSALLAMAVGLLLVAAGWVAERWCRTDGTDGDDGAEPEAV